MNANDFILTDDEIDILERAVEKTEDEGYDVSEEREIIKKLRKWTELFRVQSER